MARCRSFPSSRAALLRELGRWLAAAVVATAAAGVGGAGDAAAAQLARAAGPTRPAAGAAVELWFW
eukprot:SAG31_NODE_25819_length_453_cov_0.988701_1_plen_65_part_10